MGFLAVASGGTHALLPARPFLPGQPLQRGHILVSRESSVHGQPQFEIVPTNSLVRVDPNWRTAWTHRGNTPTGANTYIEYGFGADLGVVAEELMSAHKHRMAILEEGHAAQEPQEGVTVPDRPIPGLEPEQEDTRSAEERADTDADGVVSKAEKKRFEAENPGEKVKKGPIE